MRKPLVLCVCGTDTDAGKTVATASLLAAMRSLGVDAHAVKPVQTGCNVLADGALLAPDVLVYQSAAPDAPASALVCFEEACSPHLAAERAGTRLEVADLADRLEQYAQKADVLLVEAAGGLLAPLNERENMADLFAELSRRLDARVVLAAANRLGAVNHALLSLECLRSRGMEPAGVIMCNTSPVEASSSFEATLRKDNLRFISEQGRVPCLAELPHVSGLGDSVLSGFGQGCQDADKNSGADGCEKTSAWAEFARQLRPAAGELLRESQSSSGSGFDRKNSGENVSVDSKSAGNIVKSSDDVTKRADGGVKDSDEYGSCCHATAAQTSRLLEFDREHLWHPYTSALEPLKAWEAYATEGPYIRLRYAQPESEPVASGVLPHGVTVDGNFDGRVLDGMSSWWAAIHGYNHPALMEALHAQANVMPHVMFGGITHRPAVELCKQLLALAPGSMEYVFLADSGSVSVEVAIKMAVQYQQATGHPEKSSVLTVCGGYHGDTLGAMSVCDPVNGMHGLFTGILPRQIFAPRPECRFDEPFDPASLEPISRLFAENAGKVAAVMLEPIVQGAGGMWFYHPQYLAGLRELCDRHGALLILDEIATGFGRTGKMFACQWAGIEPDIMCVGKALTGGVMTLAATLARRRVAHGISNGGGVLMHGPTFMGNPLACSVALASLKLLAESPWQETVTRMEKQMRAALEPCRACEGVRDVRVLGAIGVVEMERGVNVEALQDFFVRERKVWIRPFGKLIYIMPPYVVSVNELERLCGAIAAALENKKWV
ncbi:adenosylmethionine--8-amino-7-oxononanoate transaminase [Desulfovibrio sp. OttesenSCG-928-C06]|nr:adenosylmethionine--8-amino-7-oxononanoate transaminase [Desulfovibrio sp. OttesenSCG-928-C06]